jgi:hypothetical protein
LEYNRKRITITRPADPGGYFPFFYEVSMYTVEVTIRGIAPLMQHRYPLPDLSQLSKGGKKSTGAKDYSDEWRSYLYTANGQVVQPSCHIEGALVKAAAGFKITGKRGKSYKDLFSANVIIDPVEIPHGIPAPDELDCDADKPLYIDMRPVIVNRARVVRLRPTLKPGWQLSFTINVTDDELPYEILSDVLTLAGKTVGIGDYRPKFGRFMVTKFELVK